MCQLFYSQAPKPVDSAHCFRVKLRAQAALFIEHNKPCCSLKIKHRKFSISKMASLITSGGDKGGRTLSGRENNVIHDQLISSTQDTRCSMSKDNPIPHNSTPIQYVVINANKGLALWLHTPRWIPPQAHHTPVRNTALPPK